MVVFGRELKGFLPTPNQKFQPRQEWRLEADLRERAHAKRHACMEECLATHARPLPRLQNGDTVDIQDLSDPCKPGRWSKMGTVVETLPFESYMVRVDGSRQVTQRHRRHLRKITTYASLLSKGQSSEGAAVEPGCGLPPLRSSEEGLHLDSGTPFEVPGAAGGLPGGL